MAQKKQNKKIILKSFLLFLGIFVIETVIAQVAIIVTGSWSLSIDSTDLVSGAGSDINSPFQSLTNQVDLELAGGHPFRDNWRVDVHRSDSNWDTNFQIFVTRTGDGTGHNRSAISGGLSYQEITVTSQLFFSGNGDRSGIPLQLQLDGVSVQTPPDLYSTTIIYTFVSL